MTTAARRLPEAPFSPLRGEPDGGLSLAPLRLRAFGTRGEDLDIDFERAARPYLETELLRACARAADGGALPPELFWEMETGRRTECLLAIAGLSDGRDLSVALRCGNPECDEALEVELTLAELAGLQRESEADILFEVRVGDTAVTVRRPTGSDQRALLERRDLSPTDAAAEMATRLIVAGRENLACGDALLPETWVRAIGEALEERDPLVGFSMLVNCPFCGAQQPHSADLGAEALRRLRAAQQGLVEMVHQLAGHYHWSEREILALPPWRRARYLSFVERERFE